MEQETIELTENKLNYFERYLSVWVGACMIVHGGPRILDQAIS